MKKHGFAKQAIAQVVLLCFVQMLFFPVVGFSQPLECQFDKSNPTLENARLSFRTLNYACAEEEIEAFLKLEDITIEEKADAHVLLAAVYYAKLKNDEEKRNQVVSQFKQAFQAYRAWKGDLDISSTEFFEMMQEAQAQVDEEAEQTVIEEETPAIVEQPATASEPKIEEVEQPAKVEDEQPAVASMPAYEGGSVKESKPWYKKWWAIGLGVGLIAGVVVLAGGGGSDDGGGSTDTTLPDFPDPPPAGKNNPNSKIKK
ncbi:MAG: hypothetical protein R3F48_16240 [Candidatus Zixiibacteriota bacterium]